MKLNLDFYQHFTDSDQHPKFKMLRIKYGWSGEGKFWALNNRIAMAENCNLDTTKKYNMASIASDLDFSMEELSEFIDYLCSECNLLIKENGFITTKIIQENFERVFSKREKNQEDYKKRIKDALRNCKRTETEIQISENIQTKQNKTKLNKNKINIIPPMLSDVKDFFTQNGMPDQAEVFFNYYESNGWMVGKNKMKNWNASASMWMSRNNGGKNKAEKSVGYNSETTGQVPIEKQIEELEELERTVGLDMPSAKRLEKLKKQLNGGE